MKKSFIGGLFSILTLNVMGFIPIVHSESVEEQKVLAALTLNFARFTQWPVTSELAKDFSIKLCVIGDNSVQFAFETVNGKKVGTKTAEVINMNKLRGINECHVLYISQFERNLLLPLLSEINNFPVLTIGRDLQFLEDGGKVCFEKIDGKMKININLRSVQESNLTISSRLLKLAKIWE